MLMVPASTPGQIVAALWLLACFALLVFGYVQRDVHDMPVAFLWLLVALSFPVGLVGLLLVGGIWTPLSTYLGFSYHPFPDLLPYWIVIVALGYVQWFWAVPRLIGKLLDALQRI